MYDYAHRDWFYQDGTIKKWKIEIPSTIPEGDPIILTNSNLDEDSIEIDDGILSKDYLAFNNCRSAYIRFVILQNELIAEESLIERKIVVSISLNDDPTLIPIGSFTVKVDNLNTDGKTREVVAYDYMFNVINGDATDWYNSLQFPITQKDFRDSFCAEFGVEQDNEVLINDDISFPKQLSENDIVSGGAILGSLAELNGVFVHIGKDGLLHWITLDSDDINEKPLYPNATTYPGEKVFPGEHYYAGNAYDITKDQYEENTVIWANYITLPADGVQIRNEINEISYQTDSEALNPYTVINNFLCYSLSYGQYETIATRLYEKIKKIFYVPFQMKKMGDPCCEVGDRVIIHAQDDVTFVSYIFTKKYSGIQVPWDQITTPGELLFSQYEIGLNQSVAAKLKNLDQRVGNMEKSGSGPLQIISVETEPANPQLNVLYLIQGEVREI